MVVGSWPGFWKDAHTCCAHLSLDNGREDDGDGAVLVRLIYSSPVVCTRVSKVMAWKRHSEA